MLWRRWKKGNFSIEVLLSKSYASTVTPRSLICSAGKRWHSPTPPIQVFPFLLSLYAVKKLFLFSSYTGNSIVVKVPKPEWDDASSFFRAKDCLGSKCLPLRSLSPQAIVKIGSKLFGKRRFCENLRNWYLHWETTQSARNCHMSIRKVAARTNEAGLWLSKSKENSIARLPYCKKSTPRIQPDAVAGAKKQETSKWNPRKAIKSSTKSIISMAKRV